VQGQIGNCYPLGRKINALLRKQQRDNVISPRGLSIPPNLRGISGGERMEQTFFGILFRNFGSVRREVGLKLRKLGISIIPTRVARPVSSGPEIELDMVLICKFSI